VIGARIHARRAALRTSSEARNAAFALRADLACGARSSARAAVLGIDVGVGARVAAERDPGPARAPCAAARPRSGGIAARARRAAAAARPREHRGEERGRRSSSARGAPESARHAAPGVPHALA
jgi:hypothetical protein